MACAVIHSQLDYCNSLYVRMLDLANLAKPHRIQNSLARIVTSTKKHDHITPVLNQLHWLPVCQWTIYKTAVLTCKSWVWEKITARAVGAPEYGGGPCALHIAQPA